MNSSTDSNPEQVHNNLVENALDFLLSAAEAVQRDNGPRSLKEAVLNLADGSDLLIKARLMREHWSLIFSDTDQASYEKLSEAEFRSVDFRKAVERLGKIGLVHIDKSVIVHVENLRKLRNRLTHFTTTLDSAQTKSLVAKSMKFCVEFCEQQGMVNHDMESKLGEIHVNLTELEEFVEERLETISQEWMDALVWECPECWQKALVIDGGDAECKFCRHKAEPQNLASTNGEGPPEECPECGEEGTFAFVLHSNEDGSWICFACGQCGENYVPCIRCGLMLQITDPDELEICSSCRSHIMSRG